MPLIRSNSQLKTDVSVLNNLKGIIFGSWSGGTAASGTAQIISGASIASSIETLPSSTGAVAINCIIAPPTDGTYLIHASASVSFDGALADRGSRVVINILEETAVGSATWTAIAESGPSATGGTGVTAATFVGTASQPWHVRSIVANKKIRIGLTSASTVSSYSVTSAWMLLIKVG